MLVTASWLLSGSGIASALPTAKLVSRPAAQMPPRVPDIGIRHIEAVNGKPRPGLFDEVEKAAGAAADIQKRKLALIAAGEDLVKRRQRLPPDRIGAAVEQHLDLGVVALGGVIGHPAAGLEMEILQIVARPLAAGLAVEHLVMHRLLAALMDVGKIGKKQPRTRDAA